MNEKRVVSFNTKVGVIQADKDMQILEMKFYRPEEKLEDGGFSCEYEMLLDDQVLDEQIGYGADSFQAVYEVIYLAKAQMSALVSDNGYDVHYLDDNNNEDIVNTLFPSVDALFFDL